MPERLLRIVRNMHSYLNTCSVRTEGPTRGQMARVIGNPTECAQLLQTETNRLDRTAADCHLMDGRLEADPTFRDLEGEISGVEPPHAANHAGPAPANA
jgi:hypothetical protein